MSGPRHRRGGGEGHEGNSERWLLTYADMITLLLALFIVLFSFSSIDVKKFLELRLGLTAAFNPTAVAEKGGNGLLQQTSLASSPGTNSSMQPVLEPEQGNQSQGNGSGSIDSPSATQIADELKVALQKAGLTTGAQVSVSERGVVVQILADKAFFASGSATLGASGRKVVDLIATVVRGDPNDLVVEGFTDNVPVTGGPFSSNWELSAVRAANVVQRLNLVDGIQSARLSSQGFGDTDPIASNRTAKGRMENRRVDVVVLNTTS